MEVVLKRGFFKHVVVDVDLWHSCFVFATFEIVFFIVRFSFFFVLACFLVDWWVERRVGLREQFLVVVKLGSLFLSILDFGS